MSEEEKKAIEVLKICVNFWQEQYVLSDNTEDKIMAEEEIAVNQTLLNLIEKQQNEIENITQYAEWHISHITEDIKDYIDDDKKGNENIIAELKEQREHWKDIIRITKNEKTYIDYYED